MNNLDLRPYPLVKLSLSVFILMSVSVQSRADTLYGPLKSGETLSSIVNENYLVSPFEDRIIMNEIFRLNPQAFISNNMGLVKQGVMLTLPSDDTIRRSPIQGSISVVPATTRQGSAETIALNRSLNETLEQVRNERDQAQLKLNRLQAESAEQSETLNAKIKQLDSDNKSTTRQLITAQAEITELKQSIERTRQENIQLVAKVQTVPVSSDVNDVIAKELDDSKLIIAQKQQQISDLEVTVTELKAAANDVNSAHTAAVTELRSSYEILETKLAQQVQARTSDVNGSVTESSAQIDELNLQHQQALSDLNATFDAEIAQKSGIQESLKSELDAAKASMDSTQEELADLRNRNSELELALSDSLSVHETLKSESGANTDLVGLANTGTIDTLLNGPVTKALIAQEMQKPVAFPLWGLLLGCFALGFTSLMMLFPRKRRQVVQSINSSNTPNASIEVTTKAVNVENEALVFRSANMDALQEPDIETLRVPPRRDPSRVAIVDPSMVATAASVKDAEPAINTELVSESYIALTPHEASEAKLKLLIADTYVEIGNIQAANELLEEVQLEGGSVDRVAAGELLARINQ